MWTELGGKTSEKVRRNKAKARRGGGKVWVLTEVHTKMTVVVYYESIK